MTSGLPLLQTKLLRPRIMRSIIYRPHLWAQLDSSIDKPLTLICAGAGYGKTTLVSSWLEHRSNTSASSVPAGDARRVGPDAWLTLDENDNSLTTFLRYVIAALRTVAPEACDDTLSLLRSPQQLPHSLIRTTLVNDLMLLPKRLILVLDDYSAISNPLVTEIVTLLALSFFPHLHLVILTREVGDLPLTHLRAYDSVTEIRSRDLRFSQAEIALYLNRVLPDALPEEQLNAFEQQTEGWIAGLKLAVLALRSGRSTGVTLHTAATNDVVIAEFLAVEVLQRQPPAIQSFLLKSSVVDHFCAPLCQALLGSEEVGWDSLTCIKWLMRSDLFIVSLSPRADWFRYHHLFLSMLRQQAATNLSQAEVQELHRRAAAWYGEQGLIYEAIHHAVAADDMSMASAIMWRALHAVLNHEDRPTLERWLSMLPDDFVQERPELLLIRAWLLQFRWQLRPLADTTRQIEALLETREGADLSDLQPSLDPAIKAQMAIFYGQAAYQANRPHEAIVFLQSALKLLPADATYLRGGAMLYLGTSLQATGHFAEAERLLLEEHEGYANKRDGFALRLCLSLCFCYTAQGKLEEARQIAFDMLVHAQNSDLPTLQSWAHYFLGLVHYQWNDLTAAHAHFTAIVARRYLANMAAVRAGMSQLALLHQVSGNSHEASQVLNQLAEIDLDHQGREDDATRAMRAWLSCLAGDIDAAMRWAAAFTAPVANVALLWLANPHVIKTRILLTRGGTDNLTAAASCLDELLGIAERTYNIRAEIELLTLKATALHGAGHYDAALATLRRAVTLAQPGGFVRVFVDAGPQLRPLLVRLGQHGLAVRHLLGAFAPEAAPVTHTSTYTQDAVNGTEPSLIEPLTARELDVLTLLREPISTKEIAHRLAITPATLKRHTVNIYSKLGVNSRWDAVTRGEILGKLQSR